MLNGVLMLGGKKRCQDAKKDFLASICLESVPDTLSSAPYPHDTLSSPNSSRLNLE